MVNKWTTEAKFVDLETGEVIKGKKEDILKKFKIITRNGKAEHTGNNRFIKTITYGCERRPYEQLEFEF